MISTPRLIDSNKAVPPPLFLNTASNCPAPGPVVFSNGPPFHPPLSAPPLLPGHSHAPVSSLAQATSGYRPTKTSVDAALDIWDRLDKVERELKLAMGLQSKVQVLATRVEELERNEERIATLEQELTEAKRKIDALENRDSRLEDADDKGESRSGNGRAGVKKGKKALPGEGSQIQSALVVGRVTMRFAEVFRALLIADMSRHTARRLH